MDYHVTVGKVMTLLEERKVCCSSQKSHRECYFSLGSFLDRTGQKYSQISRNEWLSLIQNEYPRQRCAVWTQYIFQLEEMEATGTISDRRLYFNRSNYNKLPAILKRDLDGYLDDCRGRYTTRTWELTRIFCSEALLFLFDNGIFGIREVSYQAIMDLMEMDMFCSQKTKMLIIQHAAAMMSFFGQKGMCPAGFGILLDSRMYPHVGKMDRFSLANQSIIEKNRDQSADFPVDEYRDTIVPFIETLQKHGYVGTTLNLARHSLTALYLFLDINKLGYHPEIMWVWFSEIRGKTGRSWTHWRRILRCYEEFTTLGDIMPEGKYKYNPSSMEMLPDWCRHAIEAFISQKRREFREEGTIRAYTYSCIRFCRFLIGHGYKCFGQLSPAVIKEFGHQDIHTTFRGRSGCYAVVRGFLRFLGENGYTTAALHNCLLSGSAPEMRPVPGIESPYFKTKLYELLNELDEAQIIEFINSLNLFLEYRHRKEN